MIKINPVWIIVGQFLAILVLTIFLVKSCNTKTEIVTPAPVIIEQVVANEDSSKVIIDSLQASIDKRDSLLVVVNNDLESATELVQELLNEPPLIITKTKVDSVNLATYLETVRKENYTKDSLTTLVISGKDEIINNQKQQLSEKDILYSKNRSLTDALASNQNTLEKVNLGLSKKLNRAKTGNKILIGAAATLAAIVIIKK